MISSSCLVARGVEHDRRRRNEALQGHGVRLGPAGVDRRGRRLGREHGVQAVVGTRMEMGELALDQEGLRWAGRLARRQDQRSSARHRDAARLVAHARQLERRALPAPPPSAGPSAADRAACGDSSAWCAGVRRPAWATAPWRTVYAGLGGRLGEVVSLTMSDEHVGFVSRVPARDSLHDVVHKLRDPVVARRPWSRPRSEPRRRLPSSRSRSGARHRRC